MFKVGDVVSYGLHGKCMIASIEEKSINNEKLSFYSLITLKNPIIEKHVMKSPIKDTNKILVPVQTAAEKGLRSLMTKAETEEALRLLQSSEYHFELSGPWISKQKILEETIRKEGWIGLTKVVGYLHVLIHKDTVPHPEIKKLYENAHRILQRELGDSMELTAKDIEPILKKALRQKLALDH